MTKIIRACTSRLMPVIATLLLAACAGTTVNNINSHPSDTRPGAPTSITVLTESDLIPPRHESVEQQKTEATEMEAQLQDSLRHMLLARHLAVVAADEHPSIILRCRIIDVRSGSKALRLLVGYGAGKAILRVKVSLETPGNPEALPLLAFEADSTSGGMPGSGFSASGMVGAGLGSFRKDGLPKELTQTTDHIDQELGKYFVAQHWPYATPTSPDVATQTSNKSGNASHD